MYDSLHSTLRARGITKANDELIRHLPDNGSATIVAVGIALVATAAVFVAVRFGSQYVLRGRWKVDDWVLLASLAVSVVHSALHCARVRYGWGRHEDDLPPEYLKMAFMMLYFSQISYKLTVTLTKTSIVLLYLHIFPLPRFTKICWAFIGLFIAFGIGTIFGSVFQCSPIRRSWDHKMKGHCINKASFWLADGCLFITTDIMVLILPMPVVASLNLPLRRKVGLIGIFGVGICACAASIVRATSVRASFLAVDPTWNIIQTSYMSTIEANLGIICACLPHLKFPLAFLFPRLFPSHSSTHRPALSSERDSHQTASRKRSIFHDRLTPNTNNDEELGSVKLSGRTGRLSRTEMHGSRWGMPKGDDMELGFVVGGRGDSEERILKGEDAERGIRKTVGVSVRVESMDQGDGETGTK